MAIDAVSAGAPGIPKRRSVADDAAFTIRRLIFDGELPPGSRVPQDDIARALDISRIPIREALIGLEREGWVTIELNRGAFVNAFDEAAVIDHYELYGHTHEFAVTRAIERADRAELCAALVDIAADIADCSDPFRFSELAMRFHRIVLDAAASRPTNTVAAALSWLVPGNFFDLVPGAMELQRDALPAIADAVESGDAATAGATYRRLMSQTGSVVLTVFEDRGLIAQHEEPQPTTTQPTTTQH